MRDTIFFYIYIKNIIILRVKMTTRTLHMLSSQFSPIKVQSWRSTVHVPLHPHIHSCVYSYDMYCYSNMYTTYCPYSLSQWNALSRNTNHPTLTPPHKHHPKHFCLFSLSNPPASFFQSQRATTTQTPRAHTCTLWVKEREFTETRG